jgi:hypothetical protein
MISGIRVVAAVLFGGVLMGLRCWNEVDAVHWAVQLAFVALVALVVGFVAGHGGWLPALTAFALGHALWVGVELRPSMPWAASDVWDWTQWRIFITTLLPTAFGAAILGAVGAWLRRLMWRPRPSPSLG